LLDEDVDDYDDGGGGGGGLRFAPCRTKTFNGPTL